MSRHIVDTVTLAAIRVAQRELGLVLSDHGEVLDPDERAEIMTALARLKEVFGPRPQERAT